MKKRNLIALASAAVLLTACIPSVNPFYTDQDVASDSRLLGEWHEKEPKSDGPGVWKFEDAGNHAYKLTVTDKDGKHGTFEAHLFKLKGEVFLDLLPSDCEFATNQADLVAAAMFPGHLLVRVPALGSELKLAFMDYDWLGKQLKENPKLVEHHIEGDRVLLTATPRALQGFVLKNLGQGQLFQAPAELIRGTPSTGAQR